MTDWGSRPIDQAVSNESGLPLAAAALGLALSWSPAFAQPSPDPFVFLQPAVHVSSDEGRRLNAGTPVARSLAAGVGEVAVFAAVATDADADRVASWVHHIAALKRSAYVAAVGRFSDPPRVADVAALSLPAGDIDDLGRCRPDRCDVKVSADALGRLQAAARRGGPEAVRTEFRRGIVDRVAAFLRRGSGYPPDLRERQAALIAGFPFLATSFPALHAHLLADRPSMLSGGESFLYWAEERLAGKPTISLYHVTLARSAAAGQPALVVASQQIYATHYVDTAFALTMLVPDAAAGTRYLVYVNRSMTDAFGGMFGGVVRYVARHRVRNDAAQVLGGLRRRMESGPPPSP